MALTTIKQRVAARRLYFWLLVEILIEKELKELKPTSDKLYKEIMDTSWH